MSAPVTGGDHPIACLELNIARAGYARASPVMGGVSKWNAMRDTGFCDVIPEVFGAVPEVVAGLLSVEAAGSGGSGIP